MDRGFFSVREGENHIRCKLLFSYYPAGDIYISLNLSLKLVRVFNILMKELDSTERAEMFYTHTHTHIYFYFSDVC